MTRRRINATPKVPIQNASCLIMETRYLLSFSRRSFMFLAAIMRDRSQERPSNGSTKLVTKSLHSEALIPKAGEVVHLIVRTLWTGYGVPTFS